MKKRRNNLSLFTDTMTAFATEPQRNRTLLRQRADGELFRYAQEREDLSDCGVQAAERAGQNDHFPLYFYLLQPRQGLYAQPAGAAACEVPGVGAGTAGSLTGAAELFRFWVFPDCTFLDISTITMVKYNSKICVDFSGTSHPFFATRPCWVCGFFHGRTDE